MPYQFELYEVPEQEQDYQAIHELWNIMKNELLDFHFESKEDALARKNREINDPTEMRFLDWKLIPYRKSNDYDQLKYYHEQGLEALVGAEFYIKRGSRLE